MSSWSGTEACKNLHPALFHERTRPQIGRPARRSHRARRRDRRGRDGLGHRAVAEFARRARDPARHRSQAIAAGDWSASANLFGNRRVFTEKEARDGMDRISPATGDVPLDQVDLVIEAAVENMEAKKKIFAALDRRPPTRTPSWPRIRRRFPSRKSPALRKIPARVVGIHFFNPVHKMQLVEVVAGAANRARRLCAARCSSRGRSASCRSW